MTDRYFVDADGELLLVPEAGDLLLHTEYGRLHVEPGEIAVIGAGRSIPGRAARRVRRAATSARTTASAFELPELGPIGANGLANARDFLYPVAAYEDREETVQVVQKFGGRLWAADYDHSPLDVVAWHGNHAAYKYDTARFNVMGTVSFDHPDPSIYTVLTSPSDTPGQANADFVIFPPRWLVGEDTFRPPWYHRNVMSEFMGLVRGVYDAKAEGFLPGGASLHNMWSAHGPDADDLRQGQHAGADAAEDHRHAGVHVRDALAAGRDYRVRPARAPHLQSDYDAVWQGVQRNFRG